VLASIWLGACGSPPAPAYVRENELAQSSRGRGQHLQAAQHYERAAAVASKPRDAEEARYRAADSYARGGDAARAEALYRALSGASGARRARAEFALADLWSASGRVEQAETQRVAAIRRYPGSGVAASALSQHLSYLRSQGGSERVLAYLDAESAALGATELGEALAYRRARELAELGRVAEARDAYLTCATRFPYPGGVYWDDALFRAAEAELTLGAPQRALAHLQRMLVQQEDASITGSYQRGRYAEAQLKIAEIYRDELHDPARARLELRQVWERHPNSRLVDDALFQEALLAHRAGDRAGTCAPLGIIVSKRPDSRYVPCAHQLCPNLAETPGRQCRGYIERAAGLAPKDASQKTED
jgi:tetratricopeptide (TPR) repeat protein